MPGELAMISILWLFTGGNRGNRGAVSFIIRSPVDSCKTVRRFRIRDYPCLAEGSAEAGASSAGLPKHAKAEKGSSLRSPFPPLPPVKWIGPEPFHRRFRRWRRCAAARHQFDQVDHGLHGLHGWGQSRDRPLLRIRDIRVIRGKEPHRFLLVSAL